MARGKGQGARGKGYYTRHTHKQVNNAGYTQVINSRCHIKLIHPSTINLNSRILFCFPATKVQELLKFITVWTHQLVNRHGGELGLCAVPPPLHCNYCILDEAGNQLSYTIAHTHIHTHTYTKLSQPTATRSQHSKTATDGNTDIL